MANGPDTTLITTLTILSMDFKRTLRFPKLKGSMVQEMTITSKVGIKMDSRSTDNGTSTE